MAGRSSGIGPKVDDAKYEAQVEQGYAKQTLFISRDMDVSHNDNDLLELISPVVDDKAVGRKYMKSPSRYIQPEA